ncbi:Kelch-like protein 5 [Hordeum vulgare]|nr:Kelch-like protein 5 [Hordeum vulgare]
MQQIFSFGLGTGKHAMGFGQPLGSPIPEKWKRASFTDEELNVLSNMTEAVKEVATAMKESKIMDVHPQLYGAVMDHTDFIREALMVALSHLLDNKAKGVWFVAMGPQPIGCSG